MTTPIALLLIALLLAGAGLFVRAYVRGMRFGERMEEQKVTRQKEKTEAQKPDIPDSSGTP